ncbi:MAG TPA: hypothetical protein VGW78_03630 [Candidatus Babeliales bacterium]|jgi:hypothetical protein|nr:hypothetical protein [Candidatus Babeliales bacterium]
MKKLLLIVAIATAPVGAEQNNSNTESNIKQENHTFIIHTMDGRTIVTQDWHLMLCNNLEHNLKHISEASSDCLYDNCCTGVNLLCYTYATEFYLSSHERIEWGKKFITCIEHKIQNTENLDLDLVSEINTLKKELIEFINNLEQFGKENPFFIN